MTFHSTGKNQSLTRKTAWVLAAKVGAFAVSIALPLVLVRRFNQVEFGAYKQIFLFIETVALMLPLGFGMSIFYFLPRRKGMSERTQIVLNITLFNFVIGVIACALVLLRPSWPATILNIPDLPHYSRLIGPVILLWICGSFLEIAAVARQEMKLASTFIFGIRVTRAAALLFAAFLHPSVVALLVAAAVQGILQAITLFIYLASRFGNFWKGFEWQGMRTQLAYALPHGFSGVIFILFNYLDNYFVSYRYGAASYAIYAIGCFNIPLVGLVSEAVGQVLIPRVNELQQNEKREEIIKVIAGMIRKLGALYFPLYCFLLVTGREFISVLFTSRYLTAWPIFAINLTLIPLGILASASDPVIRAYAEQRYFPLKVRLILLVAFIVALPFGLNHFGLLGAISIAIAINTVERLIVAYRVKKILGVSRRHWQWLKDAGKAMLAAMCAGLGTVAIRSFFNDQRPFSVLLFSALFFSVLYFLMLLLLGFFLSEEKEMVRRRWQDFRGDGVSPAQS